MGGRFGRGERLAHGEDMYAPGGGLLRSEVSLAKEVLDMINLFATKPVSG